ncbi:hypothetical protein GOOTI_245_00040 [Gordonia otitidis NBRC 100426]|uniref:Uncharacterized protein n=2 Tax=Gordonia otitidis TaxID=249058 RepID=H5TTZ5_GORO1|nr:hypothetical protein GOOTI_245_00040 [Gordonia otitidis NBRC 100426]
MLCCTLTAMNFADGGFSNPDPVKPPFLAPMLHKGIGIWWFLLVIGVIALAISAYLYFSGRVRIDSRVPLGAAASTAIGALCMYMSY